MDNNSLLLDLSLVILSFQESDYKYQCLTWDVYVGKRSWEGLDIILMQIQEQ